MILRPVETLLAFALAAAFAALGDLLLSRRSRALSDWNESFLAGAGAGSAALFPLSLLAGGRALTILLLLLTTAAMLRLGIALRGKRTRPAPARKGRTDPVSALFLGLAVCACIAFAVANARYPLLWDGFQIWATKAQVLEWSGRLSPEPWPETRYLDRLVNYPPLVPMLEALLSRLRGAFDFDAVKPVFLLFYLSMILSTHRAARALLPQQEALAVTALVAFLPPLSTRSAAGGYADLPLAAFAAGTLAAALRIDKESRESRLAFALLAGSLLMVKNEGLVLFTVTLLVAAPAWRRHLGEVFVLALFLALRLGYLSWLAVPDDTYGPLDAAHLRQALDRASEVALRCGREGLHWRAWGLFWPAFALAVPALLWRSSARERRVAAAAALSVCANTGVFLFTNWPVALHIEQSYSRLLSQIAPVAAVVIAAAWWRIGPASAERQDNDSLAARKA